MVDFLFFVVVVDALPSKEPLKAVENIAPKENKLDPVEDNATTNTDGDFIDDDFGLSIKREWEHLRQQQLRIEEEVRCASNLKLSLKNFFFEQI